MHAWPELYFANYGWVRFEPTPGVQTGSPPAVDRPHRRRRQPERERRAPRRPRAARRRARRPRRARPRRTHPSRPRRRPRRIPWRTISLVAGGVVLLLALAAPAAFRVRRRRIRLDGQGPTDEQVEAAWAELRDTVLDFGGTWPQGTPRTVGRELGQPPGPRRPRGPRPRRDPRRTRPLRPRPRRPEPGRRPPRDDRLPPHRPQRPRRHGPAPPRLPRARVPVPPPLSARVPAGLDPLGRHRGPSPGTAEQRQQDRTSTRTESAFPAARCAGARARCCGRGSGAARRRGRRLRPARLHPDHER